jgi:drug/metabolite transporter (DMT)-like permease
VIIAGERPLDLSRHIRAGILLGVPNFFSIYFLMAMLESGWSGSILYPINNLGILLFASFFGWLIFGERLDKKHAVGFLLSLIAISALIASNYL